MKRRDFIKATLAAGAVPLVARAELPDLTDIHKDIGPELSRSAGRLSDVDWAGVSTMAKFEYLELTKRMSATVKVEFTSAKPGIYGSFEVNERMFQDFHIEDKDFEAKLARQVAESLFEKQISDQIEHSPNNPKGQWFMHSVKYYEMKGDQLALNAEQFPGVAAVDKILVTDHPALLEESKRIKLELSTLESIRFHVNTIGSGADLRISFGA